MRNQVIETEIGKEKQCSKCKEFWPLDSEFFFSRLREPRKDGSRRKGYDSVCKACYDVVYRKTEVTRKNHIRSKAEKLV